MKFSDICVKKSELYLCLTDFCFADILLPSLHKGLMTQTHYILPASGKPAFSLRVDLGNTYGSFREDFEESRAGLSADVDTFPYGLSQPQWWGYCTAPHSYLALDDGNCQVGLNLFNRFLHLDLNRQSAGLVDPGVGDELLSSTNWFDAERQELWFASWPAEATVRRILNPREDVRVTIWRLSIRERSVARVWQGDLGDSLHQLSLNPEHRFLILTELGLRPEATAAGGSPHRDRPAWKKMRERGIVPSKILVLDLKTGKEWRLPMLTAAHVEFDPGRPDICYLSGHNIGLIGGKVCIFGTGTIQKFLLKESGPELLGDFTHSRFHRVTTHILFQHEGRTLIGVSGYPGTVFLIEAETMKLYKTLGMDSKEIVDSSQLPHICRQDSYGISASVDGRYVLAAGTGFVRIADINAGRFIFSGKIDGCDPNSFFSGHAGTLGSPRRI
jgi:hypothetical protein